MGSIKDEDESDLIYYQSRFRSLLEEYLEATKTDMVDSAYILQKQGGEKIRLISKDHNASPEELAIEQSLGCLFDGWLTKLKIKETEETEKPQLFCGIKIKDQKKGLNFWIISGKRDWGEALLKELKQCVTPPVRDGVESWCSSAAEVQAEDGTSSWEVYVSLSGFEVLQTIFPSQEDGEPPVQESDDDSFKSSTESVPKEKLNIKERSIVPDAEKEDLEFKCGGPTIDPNLIPRGKDNPRSYLRPVVCGVAGVAGLCAGLIGGFAFAGFGGATLTGGLAAKMGIAALLAGLAANPVGAIVIGVVGSAVCAAVLGFFLYKGCRYIQARREARKDSFLDKIDADASKEQAYSNEYKSLSDLIPSSDGCQDQNCTSSPIPMPV